MKKPVIKRLALSKYFSRSFIEREKLKLSKVCTYIDDEGSSNQPSEIMITNTDVDIESLWKSGSLEGTKLIIHPNSGYDNFSKLFIKNAKIPVILGNPIRQEAVVSYCMSCFFETFSTIPWADRWDESRNWSRVPLPSVKVLIIGYGHVGRSLEKKLRLFTNNIFIHDPFQNKDAISMKSGADIIFLCCGLNETTAELIDESFLSDLKSNVCLVNPARGGIVKQSALLDFLQQNSSSKAFLDVFQKEPCTLSQFQSFSNIFTSCHIAGVYDGIEEAIINFEHKVISDWNNLDDETFFEIYQHELLENKIIQNTLI